MPDEVSESRLQQAHSWAAQQLGQADLAIKPISGDASFRRYFRIFVEDKTLVLMDAPPEKEDSAPFLDVARRLRNAGLHPPEVLQFDLSQGFGLLEDLGDTLYRNVIDARSALTVFPELFDVLATMAKRVAFQGLPPYDAALLQQELDLYADWYLGRHLAYEMSADETRRWTELCRALIENAQAQPQVFVHRDFHSCNLMWRDHRAPGIIDFQDAVQGPVSYDFASLIWDRYIHWPRSQIVVWMSDMYNRLAPECEFDQWIRHCDLMGVQRNLKVVGIFARLCFRDGKQDYLKLIPMFYRYLLDVTPNYPECAEFLGVLEAHACEP